VACARCPYTSRYDILWRDAADPELICVMLRCCSGPELRVLKEGRVLRSELFKTPDDVKARAAELQGQPLAVLAESL
jgi:hypothetical protein